MHAAPLPKPITEKAMDNVHPRERSLAAKYQSTAHLPYSVRRPLPNEQRRKPLSSQAELQEHFLLDVNTGKLIKRKTVGNAKAGTEAGWPCGNGHEWPYRRLKIAGEI
jgi:hypothetical protein